MNNPLPRFSVHIYLKNQYVFLLYFRTLQLLSSILQIVKCGKVRPCFGHNISLVPRDRKTTTLKLNIKKLSKWELIEKRHQMPFRNITGIWMQLLRLVDCLPSLTGQPNRLILTYIPSTNFQTIFASCSLISSLRIQNSLHSLCILHPSFSDFGPNLFFS